MDSMFRVVLGEPLTTNSPKFENSSTRAVSPVGDAATKTSHNSGVDRSVINRSTLDREATGTTDRRRNQPRKASRSCARATPYMQHPTKLECAYESSDSSPGETDSHHPLLFYVNHHATNPSCNQSIMQPIHHATNPSWHHSTIILSSSNAPPLPHTTTQPQRYTPRLALRLPSIHLHTTTLYLSRRPISTFHHPLSTIPIPILILIPLPLPPNPQNTSPTSEAAGRSRPSGTPTAPKQTQLLPSSP